MAKGTSRASKPRKSATKSPPKAGTKPASRLIDQRIRDLGDWRGETLARMRALILEADPEIIEEWKWMHSGLVARRDRLHGRDLQEGGQADLRPGAPGSRTHAPLQLQPRGKHASGHRHPRGEKCSTPTRSRR